jgi:hypothetical protein
MNEKTTEIVRCSSRIKRYFQLSQTVLSADSGICSSQSLKCVAKRVGDRHLFHLLVSTPGIFPIKYFHSQALSVELISAAFFGCSSVFDVKESDC